MTNKNEKLYDIVHVLSDGMGEVFCNLVTLRAVRTELNYLREDMDSTNPEDMRYSIVQFHHKVRLLDDLLSYTVDELGENFKQTNEASDQLFHEIVRDDGE